MLAISRTPSLTFLAKIQKVRRKEGESPSPNIVNEYQFKNMRMNSTVCDNMHSYEEILTQAVTELRKREGKRVANIIASQAVR